MQPYFYPYLGYFDLIDKSDRWIVFDVVQYIRHGWINRNRILHPHDGWQYIIAPLKKHSSEALIKDVEYNDAIAWRQKILGQLGHYRRRAPHYDTVMGLISDGLSFPETNVSRLNVHLLEQVCRFLGVEFDYTFLSEMDLPIGDIAGPGDWAFQIAKALGAEEYVNPSGGRGLFDSSAFERAGIRLSIRATDPMVYACPGYQYHQNLSIIDLMMWNDPQSIVGHLRGDTVLPRS